MIIITFGLKQMRKNDPDHEKRKKEFRKIEEDYRGCIKRRKKI